MSFEQITTGPSSAGVGNGSCAPNGLTLDQQNNVMASVGLAGKESVLQTRLANFQQQVPLSAITTAQTLISQVLNKYFLNRINRTLWIHGKLIYNTTSTNVATLTIALMAGTTTLCTITTAATNTAASTNLPVEFDFELKVVATGKGGAIQSRGNVNANIGTAAAAAIASYLDTNVGSNSITIGTNPAVGDTITVNGTLVTFIVNGGTPVGNQVALGTTAAATATALYTFLAASTDANIVKATYTNPSSGVVLAVTNTAGATPYASTSVPAKITFSTPSVDLTAAQTLSVTIAASAAVPSAQLLSASIDVLQ
jgi:hypothetical protein